jgi:hypothetical protein
MNKRLEHRLKQIEENMAVVADELGVDRRSAYRYAFDLGSGEKSFKNEMSKGNK